ncbi:hypothetical protein HOY80DRAFT_948414 [Tuber brumale]|nr:hypothetical protein HOY80DRAFT_948414 [Tuber brumale]
MNPISLSFIQCCILKGSQILTTSSASTSPEKLDPKLEVQEDNKVQKFSFLEIGSGGGILVAALARLWSQESAAAIDTTKEVLSLAIAHARRGPMVPWGKCNGINTAIEQLPKELRRQQNQFDVVMLMQVVECVPVSEFAPEHRHGACQA